MTILEDINKWQELSQLAQIKRPKEILEALSLSYEDTNNLSIEQLLKLKFVMSSYNIYISYEVGRCKSRMTYYQYNNDSKYIQEKIKYEMIQQMPIAISTYIKALSDIINYRGAKK